MNKDTKSIKRLLDEEDMRNLALHALLPELSRRSHLFKLSDAIGWTNALRVMQVLGSRRLWIPRMHFSRRTRELTMALVNIYKCGRSVEWAMERYRLPKSALRDAMAALDKYQRLAQSLRANQPPTSPASEEDVSE